MKHGPLSSEWRNVPEYDRRVKTGIYLALTILVLCVAPAFSQLSPAPARGKIPDDNKADVGYPCWAMGAVVGDYNGDGWPDLLVTCFGGVVLYRNNGDGTFADVTQQTGLGKDAGWATGAAFGDYDNDGWVDLFVSHYVDR